MITLTTLVGVALASLFAITVAAEGDLNTAAASADQQVCRHCGEAFDNWEVTSWPSKDNNGELSCGCGRTHASIPALTKDNYSGTAYCQYICTATCMQPGQEKFVYKNGKQSFTFTFDMDELGHDMVGPTCTEPRKCQRPNCAYTDMPALGHTEVVDVAVAPTCTETGLTEGAHCSVCDEVFVAQEVVPALGHSTKDYHGRAATCTEIGWEAYEACVRCEYTTYVEIPATGHPYGDFIPAVAAKHTVDELAPSVAAHYHCVCGTYFTERKVETKLEDLTGLTPVHTYEIRKMDATKHWMECSCGKVSEETAHDFDMIEHEGHLRRMCRTCGYFNRDDYYRFSVVSGDKLTDKDPATAAIERVLAENLEKLLQNSGEYLSATLYNVTLQYWDGKTYASAGREHFSADGKMTVTLPLDGIVSDTLNVYVAARSKVAGNTEIFTVGNGLTVTTDRESNQTLLTFTVTELSHVMVGFGCAEHADANFDHDCDHVGCTYDSVGAHEDPDSDHVCNYCKNEMSGCIDADQNHLCDICCVVLGECVDADEDGVCDICNAGAKEDKTKLLVPLMILLVLLIVFCTVTIYFLLSSKKPVYVTKPMTVVAKKTKPAVASKAEAKVSVVEPWEEMTFPEMVEEVDQDEVVLPATAAEAEEVVSAEDAVATEIPPETEKAPVESAKKDNLRTSAKKKILKVAKNNTPVAISVLASVALYKGAKKQKDRIKKFFR